MACWVSGLSHEPFSLSAMRVGLYGELAVRGVVEEELALQPRASGGAHSRRAVLLEEELRTVSGRDTHAHEMISAGWQTFCGGADASELQGPKHASRECNDTSRSTHASLQ